MHQTATPGTSHLGNGDTVRAERISSGLQPRTIGRADVFASAPAWRAILLDRGHAEILSAQPPLALAAPCFAWIPWSDDCRIRIAAGSAGTHILASHPAVTNAIGHKAESADLWETTRRRSVLDLGGAAGPGGTVSDCVAGILSEAERPGIAAGTVIEAFLRILLILVWRASNPAGADTGSATPALRILGRFESLVERHFKDRWTVASYARAIGVSQDRLADICRRHRNTTPKNLVSRRIDAEARLLLRNSTHSIEQIAALLGFPNMANFSRFFRDRSGASPGAFRQRSGEAGKPRGPEVKLHDWP